MAEERVQRRLAAILAADVVGYSRMIGDDEAGTRSRFNEQFNAVVQPAIDEHRGRLVKTMGDGFLVEFGSVIDAVQCAADIQKAVAERQGSEPDDRKIIFRIGVHLGDVIVEGEDIHGDGVNIASRLEGLSEAGGICVSDMVRAGVGNKLSLGFADLGQQSLKNIAEPIRTFRVILDNSGENGTSVTDAMFRRPAVAVLPFENLSGDPDQEYFADGLTEDIITALSLWRSFPVIARNSTFAYKGQSRDVRKIGEDLAARYVIEGSVRKSGDRVRVAAQLINSDNGHHVWAERYDRSLTDIFELQDELTQRIAATVVPELEHSEQRRTAQLKTQNLDAWDYFIRGTAYTYEFSEAGGICAKEMFSKAIELDPDYCEAHTWLAWSYMWDVALGFTKSRDETIATAESIAQQALNIDRSRSNAHLVKGITAFWRQRYDEAISELETAAHLNPNNAMAQVTYGNILASSGRPDEGISAMEKGFQLDPRCPRNHSYFSFMARAHLIAGRNDQAVDWARKAVQWKRDAPLPHLVLAASLGHVGRLDEARNELNECERIRPGYLDDPNNWHPFRHEADAEHFLDGLRKAGLKNKPPNQAEALPRPDKPSIAVLPFENMSGDPEQEYFSDGITEDLITDLAKISGLFVVARNAAFLYKGKAIKPAEVSRELDVRYVLEGSVRRAGKRVRITAQLIDPLTGYHLWAERYDRDLTDIFALQDEITEKIVAALEVKLTAGEREQVERHYTENLEAYDYFLRGRAYDARSTRDANARSREMFQRAIALDPNFAGAYAVLSHTHWRDWRNQWSDDPAVLEKAFDDASMAVSLDGTLPIARTYLGWVCVFRQEYEKAVAEAEMAVRLDPGFAEGYARLAVILGFADKPKEAFEAIQNALRLDPYYPPSYDLYLGMTCFALEKYDDAVTALKKSLTRNPEALGCNLWLSAALNILGRDDEANAQMGEVMRISPKATERDLRERSPFKNQALKNLYFTVLRKAGLPK